MIETRSNLLHLSNYGLILHNFIPEEEAMEEMDEEIEAEENVKKVKNRTKNRYKNERDLTFQIFSR